MAIVLFFLILAFILFWSFFLGKSPKAEKIIWGVNFSQKHARDLGLDWKETYSAILDDLAAKNIKVAAHWDLLEPKEDEFYFDDLDWQIEEAQENDAKIILIIGMKTSRWPECHVPDWAKDIGKEKQQEEILKMIEKVILRYKDSSGIFIWQTENEPFFPFGDCQWSDKEFLGKEIALIKSLDPQNRPVLVSDSGEGSFWFAAAKMGDIVGTTMYRKVWFDFSWLKIKFPFLPDFVKKFGFYLDYNYLFPPKFYWQKANIIDKFFHKEVICVEFQAEPWCENKLLYDCSPEEQKTTMNPEQFRKNIEFAKKTGFSEFYLWGTEWIYWLKKNQNDSTIWSEAKELFKP
ncbi:MAG: hypothetical protein ABH813_00230 [Patescibacteria group bacterium]